MVGGVVGLVALGALALTATTADAYPPGTALTVAVASVGTGPGSNFTVQVVVSNAPPNCTLNFTVKDKPVGTFTTGSAAGPGVGVTFSLPLVLKPSGDDTSTIKVKTVCKPREQAKTKVLLRRAHLEVDDECRKDKRCEVKAEHYPPNVLVTFTATRSGGGSPDIIRTKNANGNGDAKLDLTFPKEGTWTVVATSTGVSEFATIQVKKK